MAIRVRTFKALGEEVIKSQERIIGNYVEELWHHLVINTPTNVSFDTPAVKSQGGATPVKTGTLRYSWHFALTGGSTSYQPVKSLYPMRPKKPTIKMRFGKFFRNGHLVNNQPYLGILNDGVKHHNFLQIAVDKASNKDYS